MKKALFPLVASLTAHAAIAQVPAPLADIASAWHRAAEPALINGVPDYSPAAVARWTQRLATSRARLAAVDRSRLSPAAAIDAALLDAEMNGLDFHLRVLRPWARDPGFYATVWAEQSDVPAHEGPNAPVIDLWRVDYPLSAADATRLNAQLSTIPALLDAARVNLAGSQAHDLFAYGARAFHDQAEMLAQLEAGTLDLRSLAGHRRADLSGQGQRLRPAIRAARVATERFAKWVETEAPRRTGRSGIGRADYDWAARNVYLSPYDWSAQEVLLKRELSRAWAGLALEEVRNRALPSLAMPQDAAAFDHLSLQKAARFTQFLIDRGMIADRPWYRAAIPAQLVRYRAPGERDFFGHVVAQDPLPLYSHFYHWIELARMAHEPHADPLRQGPLPFNIWQDRSEGVATAMEELAMQAGLYDDLPRGRELVWIMLANRAARGLASLYVQDNRMTLAEAGRFHARWTPRGWSDPDSRLVGFEQLLYLRQPGYGASYIVGKIQLDDLLAREAERASRAGKPFDAAAAIATLASPGIMPLSLVARAREAADH
ncbi:DUF885 family protein [Sphingomonas sp. NPDC079357]|uniref:DUF885 family protein n=1 Tax=Sphingomonas sp. NPDC079357 TaxID=3364518 RepID=UPI00384E6769